MPGPGPARFQSAEDVSAESAEGQGHATTKGMRSATIWTTALDTKNLVLHYHTMHNRRVRQVDFNSLIEVIRKPLDKEKAQDVEDVTPLR